MRGGAVSSARSAPLAVEVTHSPTPAGLPGQGLQPPGQHGALQTAPADRRCRPCRWRLQTLVRPRAARALREPSVCPPGSRSHVVGRGHGEPRLGLVSLM